LQVETLSTKDQKEEEQGRQPQQDRAFQILLQVFITPGFRDLHFISALAKKGVIIDSEVPAISRKKTNFYISSEAVGVFDIVAKIGGVPVEKMTLELDDLLERNYNNITRLELDQVTLDVNMTIHLINKFFLK